MITIDVTLPVARRFSISGTSDSLDQYEVPILDSDNPSPMCSAHSRSRKFWFLVEICSQFMIVYLTEGYNVLLETRDTATIYDDPSSLCGTSRVLNGRW
jgi:hypothetical protein